ncbi:MAG: hypothetical protein KF859_08905, partial [Phycisphaeraceae bacterium]|nr:hypothetical protein [Phycisphaeraceae bacterium]
GTAISAGLNAWDFANDSFETARIGLRGGFGLACMISDYMTMQLDDAYWASDWSAHDVANYAGGVAFEAWGVSMYFGDINPGGDNGSAMAAKYHKNSLKSKAKNHGYVIEKYNPNTGKWEIQKFGITAQGVDKHGRTLRGQYQANKSNASGGDVYQTRTIGEFNNRRQAAEWERRSTQEYWGTHGHNPPMQQRPSGRP